MRAPPIDSCEIRVWAGFGLQAYPVGGHPLEGLALSRSGDRFSGARFPRAPGMLEVVPTSGWPSFWRNLEASGILDLPDSSGLREHRLGPDAISQWSSTSAAALTGATGRPAKQDPPEARQFLRLLDLLRRETGFDARP